MTDTTAPDAITQADREAAQALSDHLCAMLRQQGADAPNKPVQSDGAIVQAFARHRRLAAHGAGEGLRRAFNTAWSEACCHLAPGTGLHTAERDEAWADFARSTPPTDAGSTTREGGEGVREALRLCADFIRMFRDEGVSQLGEGVHAGLRKGSDASDSGELWSAITNSQTSAWSDAVAWAHDPFFSMWGGNEALAAADAALATTSSPDASPDSGAHSDDLAVDRFAAKMKAKLARAREKGRGGWDDPEQCSPDVLSRMLHDHVAKGDPVDVANFAMMIEHYGALISPDASPDSGEAPQQHAWSGDDTRGSPDGYEGPICLKCGVADSDGEAQERKA